MLWSGSRTRYEILSTVDKTLAELRFRLLLAIFNCYTARPQLQLISIIDNLSLLIPNKRIENLHELNFALI